MYDSRDYSSPSWVRYRRLRWAFWVTPFVLVPIFFFAPIEISIILGFSYFLFTIAVPYTPCPICNKPVGRGDGLIYYFVQASPWGGHCRSCGERLFNRKWRVINLTTQSRGPPWKSNIQALHPFRRSLILVVRCSREICLESTNRALLHR